MNLKLEIVSTSESDSPILFYIALIANKSGYLFMDEVLQCRHMNDEEIEKFIEDKVTRYVYKKENVSLGEAQYVTNIDDVTPIEATKRQIFKTEYEKK